MHSFHPSSLDILACASCKRPVIDHTPEATCEACSNTGPMELFMTILMCPSCKEKEEQFQRANKATEQDRVNETLKRSQDIDYGLKVKEDIFNAETVSISDIKKAIDNDDSILNKPFVLAELLSNRINNYRKLIQEKRNEIDVANNQQRATQQALQLLASQLRKEELDKIKLNDINYQPSEKAPPKVRTVTTPKKDYNKEEITKWANYCNQPIDVVRTIMVAKKMTAEQAGTFLKEMYS